MKIIHCDVEAVPVGLGCSGVMVLCAMCVRRHADLTEWVVYAPIIAAGGEWRRWSISCRPVCQYVIARRW